MKWQPQLIVLDESHRIKNWMAKKTKMIVKLGTVADYRVIATGTSVTKKKRKKLKFHKCRDFYSQVINKMHNLKKLKAEEIWPPKVKLARTNCVLQQGAWCNLVVVEQ
jgi:hypothetical protein